MIKVLHKTERCIGCHYCVDMMPNYYSMDFSKGKALLIGAEGNPPHLLLPDTERDAFEQVVLVCPSDVIKIEKVR